MGHRTGVLGELMGAEDAHVVDPLHPPRLHVGGEFLVAEDGEPLLEGELEPVAAGDPVAGPVVEVFVADHLLDGLEVVVGGGLRACQHVAGVEDVQPLVLHGPHVEVVHGHDHVQVQIVLPAERLLVPAHGLFQGAQGMAAFVPVLLLHIDAQGHLPAGAGGEAVLDADQVTGHQGEQVAGLWETGRARPQSGGRQASSPCSTGLPLARSTG